MTSVQGTRVLAAFASLGLIMGLGACTTSGGTAVQSLGVTYSENDVTVATRQLNDLLGAGKVTRQDTVALLTQVQPLVEVAKEQGVVDPSQAYFESAAKDVLAQVAPTADIAKLNRATVEILAAQAVNSALSDALTANPQLSTEVLSLMQKPNTEVNPRYLTVSDQGLTAPTTLGDVVDLTSSPQS